jgi:hypothetical protein
MASAFLQKLQQDRHHDWRYFLTDGESLFFYATDFERMWLFEGAMPESRLRTIISTPKVMVSIFWCPVGFPVMRALPPKSKLNAEYFCDDMIPKIVKEMPFDLTILLRKLMLQMDSASPHRVRESITRRIDLIRLRLTCIYSRS